MLGFQPIDISLTDDECKVEVDLAQPESKRFYLTLVASAKNRQTAIAVQMLGS